MKYQLGFSALGTPCGIFCDVNAKSTSYLGNGVQQSHFHVLKRIILPNIKSSSGLASGRQDDKNVLKPRSKTQKEWDRSLLKELPQWLCGNLGQYWIHLSSQQVYLLLHLFLRGMMCGRN